LGEDDVGGWPREWAGTVTEVVAAQVDYYRRDRGLTVTQLAANVQMPRPVLSNLLNGKRESVSVAELCALAVALDVSPVLLVVPVGRRSSVELQPGHDMPITAALAWFVGDADTWLVDEAGGRVGKLQDYHPSDAFDQALAPLRRLRQHQASLAVALMALVETLPSRPDEVRERASAEFLSARRRLADIRSIMRTAGDVVPDLPRGLLPDGDEEGA